MRIVGLLCHTLSNLVVQTEVQNGIHHTRHRSTGTRTNTDQQWVSCITELAVHQVLDVLNSCHHVVVQDFHNLLLTNLIILITAVCSDCKTWRNGHTNVIHLGKVCTLTTQFLTHLCVTFGLSVTEEINSFLTHKINNVLLFNN